MPARSSVAALSLQPSEAQVFEAASRFYAALLGAGRINESNQQGIMRYCLRSALQLATEAEKMIQGEEQATGPAIGSEPPELDVLDVDEVVQAPPPQRPRPPSGNPGRQPQ
jgi:hypothetical protein